MKLTISASSEKGSNKSQSICIETFNGSLNPAIFLADDSNMILIEGKVDQQDLSTRRKKKRRAGDYGPKKFNDLYEPTGERLGEGAFGSVLTYRHRGTQRKYAVKIIDKRRGRSRQKVLKEVEIFHLCLGNPHIMQLLEYFEEDDQFFLVFEIMQGGTLLENVELRGHLSEQEASLVVKDIAQALDFLHGKGIAHRDLKPENVLCVNPGQMTPVKIGDFDLASGIKAQDSSGSDDDMIYTPELLTPVGSAEFMAPEVVDVWTEQAWCYDKRCDLWSLGIIMYILLVGYPPFFGHCGHDCGWEYGEACEDCQAMLFQHIQEGSLSFPNEDWQSISDDAKDLIKHLLVRNPHERYSAAEVLQHRWVACESPQVPLSTPHILQRTNSVKGLETFAENANAVNRLIATHFSISQARTPSLFHMGNHSEERTATFQVGSSDSSDSQGSFDSDTESPFWLDSPVSRRRSRLDTLTCEDDEDPIFQFDGMSRSYSRSPQRCYSATEI